MRILRGDGEGTEQGVSVTAPGTLLNEARVYLTRTPWLVNFPGAAILVSVLGLNLLGNALRDVLDSRLR